MSNGHDDDGPQLGKLLREVTPDFAPVDPTGLTTGHGSHLRLRSTLAVSAAVLVVIAVAVAITMTVHATNRPDAASSDHINTANSAPATQSPTDTPSGLSAPQADAVAQAAPCQKPESAPKLADRSAVAKLRPIAVVECEYDDLAIKGSGTWAVLIRQISLTHLDILQARFSQPDDTALLPPNTACAAIGYAPVPIYFADSTGHYLRPRTPSDACGAPLPDTGTALAAIQWRTVSITKLHRTQADIEPTNPNACQNDTQSAVQQAQTTDPAAKTTFTAQPAGKLTACIYSSLDDSGDGRGTRFLHITPRHFRSVITALTGPPSSASTRCPAQNSFAVIHDTHSGTLTVELGGCWRVAADTPTPVIVGTANSKQITALLAPTISGTR